MRSVPLLLVGLLLLSSLACVRADESTHVYKNGEPIVVYASKIGPVNNPLETYDFFKEPGCPPASSEMKTPTFGQALAGEELYPMRMNITFGHDVSYSTMCNITPAADQLQRWAFTVPNRYTYKMIIDGLPVWAPLGVMNGDDAFIYTHRSIFFGVNENRIVNVSVKTGAPQPVKEGVQYVFTYSARFFNSKTKFEDRYAVYVDHKALRPRVRWVSIVNSVLIVIFLVTVVLVIVSRTLRTDFAKMDEERRLRHEGHDTFDDSGWKQLYADVFRVPPRPALFAAVLGSGQQLLVLLVLVIATGALDSTNPVVAENRGGVAVVLYAITSFVGGYASSSNFSRFSFLSPTLARYWTRCFGLTQVLLPGPFFGSMLATNALAVLYGSAQAIHFDSLVMLFVVWLLVSCPLSLIGTLFGRYVNRRAKRRKDIPHVNQIPRLIPKSRRVLAQPLVLIAASGVLPFISIFMEVYLVLSSFWFDKSYQIYGFLALALCIYVIVTACVSVASTFALLTFENHRWPWLSFWFGASCAFYVFLYAIYFFLFKTKMTGFFMTLLYFSYSSFFCAAFACVGGGIGYSAAAAFVTRIYSQAKND